jgi:hypothetical protein
MRSLAEEGDKKLAETHHSKYIDCEQLYSLFNI